MIMHDFSKWVRGASLVCLGLAGVGWAVLSVREDTVPAISVKPAQASSVSISAPKAEEPYRSGWVRGKNFQARLTLASPELPARLMGDVAKTERLAGLHIRLEKKWKTYWRSPGSSGFPPRFDWSGSENIKSIELLWPAPQRYIDKYAVTIGYKDEVVIPIKLALRNPSKPAVLKLRLEFGVCDYICIQAEAALRADIPPPGTAPEQPYTDSLIGYFYRQVPKALQTDAALKVVDVRVTGTKGAERLVIEARYPEGAKKRELFVEAGPDLYLDTPKRLSEQEKAGALTRFAIDLSRAGGGAALKGRELTLTLVSEKAQGETHWRLK